MLPNIEIVSWRDKNLIKIEVYSSPNVPHYIKKQGEQNGVYIRLGSSNRQADQTIIDELKRIADRQAFDEMPKPRCTLDDIDFAAIETLFSPKQKLQEKDFHNLKIIDLYQKKLVPTVGGILLFGKNREKVFPDAWIQCARFHGNEKINLMDQLDIRDHLPFAIDKAIDFVKKHAFLEGKIEYIQRKDLWSVPIEAIREGIINAVIHADYSLQGITLKIAIFDNRIEISNPGLFVNGITTEDIYNGSSKIRNRVLARIFKELGLIEQWGTGFMKMKESCESYGFPNPIIEEIGGPSVLLTVFITAKKKKPVTDRELLRLLKETEKGLSTKDLANKLQLTSRSVRTRLNKLVKMGLLIPIAQSKNDPTKKYILSKSDEH